MTAKQALKKIAEHIKETSPATPVHFQPYIKQDAMRFTAPKGFIHVDLDKFYPNAKCGEAVFTACNIRVPEDEPIGVLLNGRVKVWYNGKCVFSALDGEAKAENGYSVKLIDAVKHVTGVETSWYTEVQAEQDGKNELIIETVCSEDGFEFDFNLSHTKNVTVWATDYLTWVREESPIAELSGEEGMAVSPIYTSAEEAELKFLPKPEYAFPKVEQEGNDFDLNSLFNSGNVAYAYTEAVADGEILLDFYSPAIVIRNGEREKKIEHGEESISLKKGDKILIKCLKKADKWGFSVENKDNIGLPFVRMSKDRNLNFLFCGPFYANGLAPRLAPEFNTGFSKPYQNEQGEKLYWEFYPENTNLRAYLNSSFYGQWYYANMLCIYGLYMTGKSLDDEEYDNYFYGAMHQMAEFAEYVKLDQERHGSAAFMSDSMDLTYLDYIGTMGMNFAEAYFKSGDPVFIPVLDRLKYGIGNVITRFEDGTFCRRKVNTMWADDMYMSCPFLVRLAKYTGDDAWYDDAAGQIFGFKKKLYMPEEKLFSHIYFLKEETANRIPWGRGNAWIIYAMSEILSHLPKDHKDREEILALYREFTEGIVSCQDKSGLWCQVMNKPDTYLETSCSAIFMLCLYRGIRMGWIDKSYISAARKAWEGLKSLCIGDDGTLYAICMGSGCSMDADYYAQLQTIADDDHGTGVILAAVNEMILTEEN